MTQERRGTLAEPLDEQAQFEADEEDLATLRRWFGAWRVTYDASRHDGERWDARPSCNVGRDGEQVTAPDPETLAERICTRDGVTYYRVTHEDRIIGVLRRVKDPDGERTSLFGRGNLQWGDVGAGIYDDGPETLEEIGAIEASGIAAELLRSAREG